MRFPGRRKHKHYFSSEHKGNINEQIAQQKQLYQPYIVGLDQTIVDIEAHVSSATLEHYGLLKGRSQLVTSDVAEKLYQQLTEQNLIQGQYAGGTIGNTLHNYSILADNKCVLYGVMSNQIAVGNYAYRYLSKTSSRVNLNHLYPVDGPIGLGYTLITEDGERTFAISPGKMNQIPPEAIQESVIKDSAAFVLAAYFERSKDEPLYEAALTGIEYANKHNVPVVLTLGTHHIIAEKPEWWRQFLSEKVTVLAMNEEEAEALTGISDPLLAADKALDFVDIVLCTAGKEGLYMAGYTDDLHKRQTEKPLEQKPIPEFNKYEYSRPMRKKDCQRPIKVYSHVSPFMGGPDEIKNTNGAGDGALAALLHDISANLYHKVSMPNSAKHAYPALCYSSFSQISKYANRVSYQVLIQNSPRLSKTLPEKEDCLDESYWAE
jgi:inosine kinase